VTRRLAARALVGAVGVATIVGTATATLTAEPTQISADPLTNASGQHQTAVEPDSSSFGRTIVAVFQVGRIVDGGASGIGWATSRDSGTTWQGGMLPRLTEHQAPAGPYSRVSDPAVAYDVTHGVWLASALALRDIAAETISSVIVSRSHDGVSWSAPTTAAPDVRRFNHDKPWIACDNGSDSPFAGRCYLTWTAEPGNDGVLAVATSIDGGLTWSAPSIVAAVRGSGWQPLVRLDGSVVIVYEGAREVDAVRSNDGGRSFGAEVRVGALRAAPVPGMRAEALPTADVDAAGRIVVAWQDCRFRAACRADGGVNDLVLASSTDGLKWSRVRRVRTWPELEGRTHFVPGLAVDSTTSRDSARLALAFYVLSPRGCSPADCRVAPMFVSSSDSGRAWSEPQALAEAQPIDAFPSTTSGRFVGEYISTSFGDGGVAVPVFAAASAPADGGFHQGVFATRVPLASPRPLSLRLGALTVSPHAPRLGGRVLVAVRVTGASRVTSVTCSRQGSRVRMRLLAARFGNGRASCLWALRGGASGSRVAGTVLVLTPEEEVARSFTFRVRAR
jgi:hypothetical protein